MEITGRGWLTQFEWLGLWLGLAPACVLVAAGTTLAQAQGVSQGALPVVLGIPALVSVFAAANPRLERVRHRLIAVANFLGYAALILWFWLFLRSVA